MIESFYIPPSNETNGTAAALLAAVTPTASHKKAIAEAFAEMDRLHGIILACSPDTHNQTSILHALVDEAGNAFMANPTIENAEKLHTASVRLETAKLSIGTINGGCHAGFNRVRRSLIPVANELVDQAVAALEGERVKAEAAIAKNSGVLLDTASIGRAFDAALSELDSHRSAINTDAVDWLKANGFA